MIGLRRMGAVCRMVAVCAVFSARISMAAVAEPGGKDPAQVMGPEADPAYMDTSVKPGDDFYAYCCGTWEKTTTIPSDRAAVSPATPLYDAHDRKLGDLIEEASTGGGASNDSRRRVTDVYKSFMNEAAIEARGTRPLAAPLKEIAAIRDRKQLARVLGEELRADEDALNNTSFHTPNLFGLWVAPDFNDTAHYTAYLMQGGIGLPDREYYVSDETEAMKEIRQKFGRTS